MIKKKHLFAFILLAIGIILFGYTQNMKQTFKQESLTGLERTSKLPLEIVKESDLEHLPLIVNELPRSRADEVSKRKFFIFDASIGVLDSFIPIR